MKHRDVISVQYVTLLLFIVCQIHANRALRLYLCDGNHTTFGKQKHWVGLSYSGMAHSTTGVFKNGVHFAETYKQIGIIVKISLLQYAMADLWECLEVETVTWYLSFLEHMKFYCEIKIIT